MQNIRKYIPRYLLSMFATTLYVVAFSQNSGSLNDESISSKAPFTVTDYSTKSGLPQNQVLSIVSIKNKGLVISTANGIVLFNGYEFRNFIKEEEHKSRSFNKLFYHENKNILGGISYDRNIYQIYPFFSKISLGEEATNQICSAHMNGDTLTVLTFEGHIYQMNITEAKFRHCGQTSIQQPYDIIYSHPFFYIAAESGLYQYHMLTGECNLCIKDGIGKIKQNPYTKVIYALSAKRLYRFDKKPEVLIEIEDQGPNSLCRDVTFIGDHTIFLGSGNGLYYYYKGKTTFFNKKDGLSSHYISNFYYEPSENCLFIGSDEKGLLKLQLKEAITYSSRQGFNESSLSSIIYTTDKKILVSENCCNLYEIRKDTVVSYSNAKTNYASLQAIGDSIYAGTWGDGLWIIYKEKLVKKINMPQLPSRNVHAVYRDKCGRLWVGTSNGIAMGYGSEKLRPFLAHKIIGTIMSIYETRDGDIYLGGSNGVYILKKGIYCKHIGNKMGLYGKNIRSFYRDKEGRLWIGSYDGGLYCYDKNKLTSINRMKGCMLDMDAFTLVPDSFGYLNMTSNHGLWRVKETDLNDFYEGRLPYLIPFHYDQDNGILNPEFNGGFQNNYLSMGHHIFYFPTIEGVIKFEADSIPFRKIHTSIEEIFVNDTLLTQDINILNRNTHSIKINFSCVNYLAKYNVYFQYKLVGETNADWSTPQKSTSVTLKMLPPGKYTFMVRAIDGFNDREPLMAVYSFEILPYYYETTWFKMLAALTIIILLMGFTAVRLNILRKKAEEKEEARRKLAEFEMKAIQAQMSPHFIFNCLNSIKYFVLSGQSEQAEKFLDHFSLLIRKFLENSELIHITIEEEASMLKEYLELEKMRMGNQFQYTIHYTEESKHLKIPTMLLQPHIENAIKHGIAHLKGEGKIDVSFVYDRYSKSVICHISDNGVGRKKGQEIAARIRKHIPKGMGLVQEKSKLLKQLYKKNIFIKIIDKYNSKKEPEGTMVVITIPV